MSQQLLQFAICACLGQILLIGLIIRRDLGQHFLGRCLLLLLLGVASYLVCSDKSLLQHSGYFGFVLALGSVSVPALLWVASQSLFIDEFTFQRRHIGSIMALLLIGYFNALAGNFFGAPLLTSVDERLLDLTRPMQQILNLTFMLSALYTAFQGRNDDLVDVRRRFRMYFVVLGSSATTVLALLELSVDPSQVVDLHQSVGPPIMLAAGTLMGYWLLSATEVGVLVELAEQGPVDAGSNIEPADQAVHDLLIDAFEVQKLYREHGLTIAGLADHLSTQEHHLRRIINKGLGFRNFAAFLSAYRLKDVVQIFADPKKTRTPILTIALDAGFQSIATFNRAFRHAYGSTPSAYRKNAIASISDTSDTSNPSNPSNTP